MSDQSSATNIGGSSAGPAKSIAILLMVMIGCIVLIWPGLFSYLIKASPWTPETVTSQLINAGKTPLCDLDGNLTQSGKQFLVNRLAFWDDLCATGFGDTFFACVSGDGQPVHYKECGLLARDTTSGSLLCDDPEFLSAYDNFVTMGKACAKLPGQYTGRCNTIDLAEKVFLQPTTGLPEPYDSCKACSTLTDASSPLYGLSVGENKDCSGTGVSMNKYLNYNPNVPSSESSPALKACTEKEAANGCIDSVTEFTALSPSDCMDPAYQQRKTTFVQMVNACDQIKSALPEAQQVDFEERQLEDFCPVEVPQFFTLCDPTSFDCTYTPVGCEREDGYLSCPDDVPVTKMLACTNDYETCKDPDYLKDLAVEEEFTSRCAAVVNNRKKRDRALMFSMLAIYLVIILTVVILGIAFRQKISMTVGQLGTNENVFQQQMVGTYTQKIIREVLLFLMLMWLLCAVPFGLLAQGYHLFIYKEPTDPIEQAAFDDKKNVVRILGWVLTGLTTAAILILAIILLVRGTTGEFVPTGGATRKAVDADAEEKLQQAKQLNKKQDSNKPAVTPDQVEGKLAGRGVYTHKTMRKFSNATHGRVT